MCKRILTKQSTDNAILNWVNALAALDQHDRLIAIESTEIRLDRVELHKFDTITKHIRGNEIIT